MRVFIVDDDTHEAKLLLNQLEKVGCEVRAAVSGAEALPLAEEFHPATVLLALAMAGENGYGLAKKLHQLPSMAGSRIIAISGRPIDMDRAREAGIDNHFLKPLPVELIAKAVCQSLRT